VPDTDYSKITTDSQSSTGITAYTNGSGPTTAALDAHHLAMLRERSSITLDVIKARGYRSIHDRAELAALGFDLLPRHLPGLLIPLHTSDGSQPFSVYRPDNPRVVEQRDKGKLPDGTYPCKAIKYEVPKGTTMRLDCPPVCAKDMGNPGVTLWITEGQKKADALASRGLCAVGLLGVWNWSGRNSAGGKTLLADFKSVALNGRDVRIIFDSDAATNAHVHQAGADLAKVLGNKGARVSVVTLHPDTEGGKIGVDDYFAAGGTVASLEALAATQRALAPAPAKREKPKYADYVRTLTDLGYGLRMNDCLDTTEVNGVPLTDPMAAVIRTQMRDAGFENMGAVEDAIKAYAFANRFHPVHDFLNGLIWDGQDHIRRLAGHFRDIHDPITYPDGSQRSVFHAWLLRWMLGAVGKALQSDQNAMLVLDGPQDIGKSYFAGWLGGALPGYFIEGAVNPEDKDSYLRLCSRWIWEVGELGATTRKADREALKDFITRKDVTVRAPYAKSDITKPAMASLIGTINNETGFLNDPTGSRRFLVVTLDSIDWKYTQLDARQLWGQAAALFREGHTGRLDATEKAIQRQLNGGYEIKDPIEDYILQHFDLTGDSSDFLTVADMVDRLKVLGYNGTTRAIALDFARAAKRLGIEGGRGRRARQNQTAPRGYHGIKMRPLGVPTKNDSVGTQPAEDDGIVF
jgi:putative DNA primase/helicase